MPAPNALAYFCRCTGENEFAREFLLSVAGDVVIVFADGNGERRQRPSGDAFRRRQDEIRRDQGSAAERNAGAVVVDQSYLFTTVLNLSGPGTILATLYFLRNFNMGPIS